MKMRNQAGFSLIEMIISVAVTLVVTGAIYGLIAGGNNAFRREPELTERQQNVRMGMDLIIRDVSTTGSGLPAFLQAFTRGLDACNGTPANRCPMGAGFGTTGYAPGVTGALPDDIEMIGNPGNFDGEATCHYSGAASVVRMISGGTNVNQNEVILVIMSNGTYALMNANDVDNTNKTSAGQCASKQAHTQISFNSGKGDPSGLNTSGGLCTSKITGTAQLTDPCLPVMVARGEIVRYGIRLDADGIPSLYRFSTATLSSGVTTWQLVAKGIEDMQVQYRHLDPNTNPMVPASAWLNEPPQVAGCNPANPNALCCDPGCIPPTCTQVAGCIQPNNAALARLVTEVRVTLTARSEAQNIQGATRSVAGGDRIRGSLTQTISPRSTLFALSRRPAASGGAAWR